MLLFLKLCVLISLGSCSSVNSSSRMIKDLGNTVEEGTEGRLCPSNPNSNCSDRNNNIDEKDFGNSKIRTHDNYIKILKNRNKNVIKNENPIKSSLTSSFSNMNGDFEDNKENYNNHKKNKEKKIVKSNSYMQNGLLSSLLGFVGAASFHIYNNYCTYNNNFCHIGSTVTDRFGNLLDNIHGLYSNFQEYPINTERALNENILYEPYDCSLINYQDIDFFEITDIIRNDSQKELMKNRRVVEGLNTFVDLEVSSGTNAGIRFSLTKRINSFLIQPESRFIVLKGSPGSGKSTISRKIEMSLWDSLNSVHDPVPIYINLPLYFKKNITSAILDNFFRMKKLTKEETCFLKENAYLFIIIDSFDEIRQKINLYKQEKISDLNAKMWLNTRIGSLHQRMEDILFREEESNAEQFYVRPFAGPQIEQYISTYLNYKKDIEGRNQDPQTVLEELKNMTQKLKMESHEYYPLQLYVSLNILQKIKNNIFFDLKEFIEEWTKREVLRVRYMDEREIAPEEEEEERIKLIRGIIDYSKELSLEMWINNAKECVEEIETGVKDQDWEYFFSDSKLLQREGSALVKRANGGMSFIHESVKNYFIAVQIITEFRKFDFHNLDYDEINDLKISKKLLHNDPNLLEIIVAGMDYGNTKKIKNNLMVLLQYENEQKIAQANAKLILKNYS